MYPAFELSDFAQPANTSLSLLSALYWRGADLLGEPGLARIQTYATTIPDHGAGCQVSCRFLPRNGLSPTPLCGNGRVLVSLWKCSQPLF